jgi:hypothetical protein
MNQTYYFLCSLSLVAKKLFPLALKAQRVSLHRDYYCTANHTDVLSFDDDGGDIQHKKFKSLGVYYKFLTFLSVDMDILIL